MQAGFAAEAEADNASSPIALAIKTERATSEDVRQHFWYVEDSYLPFSDTHTSSSFPCADCKDGNPTARGSSKGY